MPFFGTCQSVGQTTDGEWPGAGSKTEEEHIGPLVQEEASQSMELWKMPANKAGKLSFNFVLFKLGKFISCVSSCYLVISAREVRVRL